jgi:hypothetical protein
MNTEFGHTFWWNQDQSHGVFNSSWKNMLMKSGLGISKMNKALLFNFFEKVRVLIFFLNTKSTLYKIIGVCSQIFYLVICDWLKPPWSLESPSQSERRWNHEWKRAKWCFCFRWCHKALTFYALEAFSQLAF